MQQIKCVVLQNYYLCSNSHSPLCPPSYAFP
jgi:hypothetical protein